MCIVFALAAFAAADEEPKKIEKRGIYSGLGGYGYGGFGGVGLGYGGLSYGVRSFHYIE